MDGIFSALERNGNYINISVVKRKERDNLGDNGVEGRMILK
jgi:hypothetical protein